MSWQGKIAIVTGGGSGIGRAICTELAGHGATVVVADINREAAEVVAAELASKAGTAHAEAVDVVDSEAVAALIDATIKRHGRVDYMFNNAGVALIGEARDMSLAQWRHIVDVNLNGVLHGTTAAYARMIEQGSGHIVNMASMAGLAPMSAGTAYSMTKHAVVGLSISLRAEAADLGVKVSVVCPGFIDTPLKKASVFLGVDREGLISNFPLKFHDVDHCARATLNGVRRNKAIITVTPFAKVAWLLFRLSPSLMIGGGKFAMRRLRDRYGDRSTLSEDE